MASCTRGRSTRWELVHRSKRPDPAQFEELDAVKEEELVGAYKPSEGR